MPQLKYFKIVDTGNFQEYNKEFLNYYNTHQSNFIPKNSFWNPLKPESLSHCLINNPDFAKGIAKFGEIRQLAVLILEEKSTSLHIDPDYQQGVMARLNIPLLNCEGSRTVFFNPDTMKQLRYHVDQKSKTIVWDSNINHLLSPAAEIELIQPTILRTSSPHMVRCTTCNFPRISLTISFKNDLIGFLVS